MRSPLWKAAPIGPIACSGPPGVGSWCKGVRQLRTENPRWGKEKLTRLLHAQGWDVSVSLVGRILTHLKATG